MRRSNIFTIARKDWIEVRQNKNALLPMLLIPLLFILVIPLVFTLVIPNVEGAVDDFATDPDLQIFFQSMPAELQTQFSGMDIMQTMIMTVLGYLFAPMFLIVPLMFATTIAVESFAGEKERKTLEALLYSPVSDLELFMGKVLAAAIPATVITWICFFCYTLIVNLVPYQLFQRFWFPLPVWWLLIFWVTPSLVMMSISITVMISTKVQTFVGAYQMSSAVVLIVVVVFVGQISGILFLSPVVAAVMGFVFWGIGLLIGRLAVRSFNREKLITAQD